MKGNKTAVTTILLLEFQNLCSFKLLFFIFLLVTYCVTIAANLLIITLVSCSNNLLSPMYIFLSQLSISDILLTTNIVPKMLHVILVKEGTITVPGCIAQFYFLGASETSECLLLTLMSYDRYLAICHPLHYACIMLNTFCLKLVIVAWFVSFTVILITALTICTLEFCDQNVIDHFLCDLDPLLELSCSDTSIVQLETVFLCVPVVIVPFIAIMVSYVYIVFNVLKIPSIIGRQRAFSTCSSHLTVVSMYYGTLIGIYVLPMKGQSLTFKKILSLLYTVVTPFLNPIIYSLRNKDIKDALKGLINKMNC